MPVEHGAVTYKIKSEADKFDRIADEADLSSINDDPLIFPPI
jgi:hypothetical protein